LSAWAWPKRLFPKRFKSIYGNIVIMIINSVWFDLLQISTNYVLRKALGSLADLRKHFFFARVNIWNSLPNSVVDASTVKAFKARLDKFLMHQAVKYYFTIDLTGFGKRSD